MGLADYGDLVRWAHHDRLIEDKEARRLLRQAERHPRRALVAYRRGVELQGAIRSVFTAVARGSNPSKVELDKLNAEVGKAMVGVRLVPLDDGFRREWLDPRDDLAWFVAPVARSAADLLESTELRRLKECPGSPGRPCGFLFVDETKNRSRRWCSGATCGNRTRLHRHYSRLAAGDGND